MSAPMSQRGSILLMKSESSIYKSNSVIIHGSHIGAINPDDTQLFFFY